MNPTTAIIGATTWGTTLGIVLARRRIPVTLLARTTAEAGRLDRDRENRRFLPNLPFPSDLAVSADPAAAIPPAGLVILAVPSDHFRRNLQQIAAHLSPEAVLLSAAKGLELPRRSTDEPNPDRGTAAIPPSPHLRFVRPQPGPGNRRGKAGGYGGSRHGRRRYRLCPGTAAFPSFRVYTSDDVVGVELGGTLKNIIALGAGIADGLELGANSKSTFISRGLAEMTRLGVAAGASPATFAGLAGLGDLVATCYSPLSRNRYVGEQLGRGRSWLEIRDSMQNVVEGVNATNAALRLAAALEVEMPIAQATYRVLFEKLPPQEAVAQLMARPANTEW